MLGDKAGGDAAEESAQSGAADVDAHDDGDGVVVPFLTDVGDGDGEDSGQDESLEKAPGIEGAQAGRGGGEKRGDGEGDDGGDK